MVALNIKSTLLYKDKSKDQGWSSMLMEAIQHILNEKMAQRIHTEEERYYHEFVPISKSLVGLYLFVAFKR